MQAIKSIGGVILGIVIFLGVAIGSVLLFVFGASVAVNVAPFIYWLAGILFAVNILTLIAAIIPNARAVAGLILYMSSYVYGLATWIYGLVVTLSLWGVVAVIVGILLGGIGVVPIGMLASIFHGRWDIFFTLLITILLTYGTRVIGHLLVENSEKQKVKTDIIDLQPEESGRTWKDIE
jgi:hypothetical protein